MLDQIVNLIWVRNRKIRYRTVYAWEIYTEDLRLVAESLKHCI